MVLCNGEVSIMVRSSGNEYRDLGDEEPSEWSFWIVNRQSFLFTMTWMDSPQEGVAGSSLTEPDSGRTPSPLRLALHVK